MNGSKDEQRRWAEQCSHPADVVLRCCASSQGVDATNHESRYLHLTDAELAGDFLLSVSFAEAQKEHRSLLMRKVLEKSRDLIAEFDALEAFLAPGTPQAGGVEHVVDRCVRRGAAHGQSLEHSLLIDLEVRGKSFDGRRLLILLGENIDRSLDCLVSFLQTSRGLQRPSSP